MENISKTENNRLDFEFRQILCLIKQFIPYVTSGFNLSLYSCWLEKLSSPSIDKAVRNNYLIELAKQIKDNTISAPFDRKPHEILKNSLDDDSSNIKTNNLDENSSWTSVSSFQLNANGRGDDNSANVPMEENRNFENISLKYTNFIPADWKETIEALQLRLTETLNQNDDLKRTLESQTQELQIKRKIEEELQEYKEKYKKEQDTVGKLRKELDELRNDYEKVNSKNDDEKLTKDKEIDKLSDIIRQQCTRMSNEIAALRKRVETSNFDEKILTLRKCVSKMDKLYEKSEKEYLKRIEKLKKELSLKDKMRSAEMGSMRAELAVKSGMERQKRMDEIVNDLEVRYIKMLEFHERQVAESRRLDEERVKYLQDLLEKHNIPFKVF
ncbi:uncharacterized protein LOC130896049 [Diorhabda carinulata]|uniref:uncharacterized protein LOC130896049 n=1 Tax=Diorhabda carinulata TaxID=1163345 RepID=UPI0025A0B75A|nr:uncharacterized protein LOC130896049 [Diorhabda carinulata]